MNLGEHQVAGEQRDTTRNGARQKVLGLCVMAVVQTEECNPAASVDEDGARLGFSWVA
jgi:hypothetical protein